MRVEYGDVVKAQYTLTKEVLNDSLDGDFKKTVTSTFYIYGDSFGSLREDGTVDWENATSPGLMLLQFDLNPNYFDQDTVSFADGFHGAVQSGAEELFFGSKDLGGSISSFVINIVTNAAQVTSVSASFKTEKGASVSSSCSFIYVPVSVDIPF